jgi:hypothetical protein
MYFKWNSLNWELNTTFEGVLLNNSAFDTSAQWNLTPLSEESY